MKKIIAVILALCLAMSTGITAFAQDKKVTSTELMKELQGAVDYLSKDSYTVDDALNLYYLVSSGAEVKNVDSFVKAVKDNLAANDGKLITSYGENLTSYAAAIQIMMNTDISDDNTFLTLINSFGKMDPTVLPDSPYYYNVIIPASIFVEDESFGKKLCDTLLKNYYVKGQGMDYYGLSCDNTAYLISALSVYSFDYEDVISDCLKVLENYKVDGGYCFSKEYGTAPNADSTALALMAYSSVYLSSDTVDETEIKAVCDEIYNDLTAFKGSKTGVYTYMNDGDNAYATADALRGISLYYTVVAIDELLSDLDNIDEETKPAEDETTSTEPEVTKEKDTSKAKAVKKSPATGDNIFGAAFGVALCAAALAVMTAKKKDNE